MKTTQLFLLVLFIGLMTGNLFAQSKADYMAKMDAQVGEWMLDKDNLKITPAMDQPVPDMKMTLTKDGDKYSRVVHVKTPDGKWLEQASETYEYNAEGKMMKFTGVEMGQNKYRGQMIIMQDGNIHGIEFNANNQKTSEMTLEMSSAEVMKASIKSFVYPTTADQDMQVINIESIWKKQ